MLMEIIKNSFRKTCWTHFLKCWNKVGEDWCSAGVIISAVAFLKLKRCNTLKQMEKMFLIKLFAQILTQGSAIEANLIRVYGLTVSLIEAT